MGKRLIQQRRGKGSIRFRSPPGRRYKAAYPVLNSEASFNGIIKDIVHSKVHTTPLAKVLCNDGRTVFLLIPNYKRVGDSISGGSNTPIEDGNICSLGSIPEGTFVYNIESNPGDGGKFVRSGGTFAKVVTKKGKKVVVELPSKKQRLFNENCRASIGSICAGGRLEKPMTKAGNKHFKIKARGGFWPVVCGQSMNAVAHPHGGKRSSKKNYPYCVSRHAPPGAKVGAISARKTGRKKR